MLHNFQLILFTGFYGDQKEYSTQNFENRKHNDILVIKSKNEK
jgi:hypothetical protein